MMGVFHCHLLFNAIQLYIVCIVISVNRLTWKYRPREQPRLYSLVKLTRTKSFTRGHTAFCGVLALPRWNAQMPVTESGEEAECILVEWNKISGRHKIHLFRVSNIHVNQTLSFFLSLALFKFLLILWHGRILPSAAIRAATPPFPPAPHPHPKWKCSIIWHVLHRAAQYGPLRSVSGGSYVTDFLYKRQMATM